MMPPPGMAERDVRQRRESRLKLPSQCREAFRTLRQRLVASAPEVIDGVVTAPEDAVVFGLAQVMKLIATVGNPVAADPTDGAQLSIVERLSR